MSRIFQFAALLVLILWVPATMHCDLESLLGLTANDCCGEHEDEPAPASATDHCALEEGSYLANQANVAIAAPELLTLWWGEALRVDPPVALTSFAPRRGAAPPELPRIWQFVARAALPARAPSFVS